LGHSLHGLLGDVTVTLLDILEHLNELVRLTTASFQDLTERLGRHVSLLLPRVYLLMFRIRDNIDDVNTEIIPT
jgi:hypothetical protein